jgi:hypothetical protein
VVDKLKLAGDAVESCFDGGIADAEGLFHVFNGAVGPEESDHKDLVFKRELGKLGEGELAFDSDLFLRNPNALDDERRSLGDTKELLPVGSGFGCGFGIVWHGLDGVSQVQKLL